MSESLFLVGAGAGGWDGVEASQSPFTCKLLAASMRGANSSCKRSLQRDESKAIQLLKTACYRPA